MTCSFVEARQALARVLSAGLGMQVDLNRDDAAEVDAVPLVVIRTGIPELVQEYLSPREYAYEDRAEVCITIQADFGGSREEEVARLAGRVEEILAGNRTLDGVIDFADCEAYDDSAPVIPGVNDIADVRVPVLLEFCTSYRSGGK